MMFHGTLIQLPPIIYDISLVLTFGTGIWLLFLERHLIHKGMLSYKWPRIKAVIKDQRDESFYLTGFSYTSFRDASIRFQQIAYIYEYKINNHVYRSSNYCFGGYSDRCDATFVIGQHIHVSYNPSNPKESVIRYGLMPGALIGLALILVGIFGLAIRLYPTY